MHMPLHPATVLAGVGGEYPVASSSAAEKAEGSKAMRRRRGERVLLVFSQQGWGERVAKGCGDGSMRAARKRPWKGSCNGMEP